MQFATNHFGHFALATGLHRALAAAGEARSCRSARRPSDLSGRVLTTSTFASVPITVAGVWTIQDGECTFRGRGHQAMGRRRHHRQCADARHNPVEPAAPSR